ncbi:hypothetical protein F66182_4816 [Fusarium sp. NRRL 66182]|nr:hypothetical protein F66182_4816 [Fusarium sp. NRRL 66182]
MALGSFLRPFFRKLFSHEKPAHMRIQTKHPPQPRCPHCKRRQFPQQEGQRNKTQGEPWPRNQTNGGHATYKHPSAGGDNWCNTARLDPPPNQLHPSDRHVAAQRRPPSTRTQTKNQKQNQPLLKETTTTAATAAATEEQERNASSRLPHESNDNLYSHRTESSVAVIADSDRSMNREAVCQVIDMIATRFSHIPYAVSGLAAMVYYGYDARPLKVSIVCPPHTRENQKCWAIAQGMTPMPRRRDIYGLATSDGVMHQVRVRFPWDFEDLHALKVGASGVTILSLAGLADELARTYVNELKHANLERQDDLAMELVWVLKRIDQTKLPEHVLRPERTPHLVKETFWLPFSLAYPDAVHLFERAGWRIPNEDWMI